MPPPVLITRHAFYRLQERRIEEHAIKRMVQIGIIIEQYPNDTPYPSRLLYGCVQGQHLHLVAAYDTINHLEIIITLYEPDPAKWQEGFLKRKIP